MISSWRKRRAERRKKKEEEETDENGVAELIIPRHFLCPISLDLMKDPVTMTSGITYDRENIERWMESGNSICPVTNKTLTSLEPIPNHSIRKMIQEWCVENRAYGIERIPTPRIPVSSYQLTGILNKVEAGRVAGDADGCRQLVSRIKALGKESERNNKCIAKTGAGRVLSAAFQAFSGHFSAEHVAVLDEILSVLAMITPLDGLALSSSSSLNAIFWFINSGDLSARRNAILVLKDLLSSENHSHNEGKKKIVDEVIEIEGGLEGLVKLIKEPISPNVTKATLLTMYHLLQSQNEKAIAKLVAMGLVEMIVEMLVDSEKGICEKALGVLDEVCSFRQGRERVYGSALSVPVLVKKMFRVSELATEFCVSVLWKIGRNVKEEAGEDAEEGVVVEALEVGAFDKLLLFLQIPCSEMTKQKVSEVLKLLNPRRFKVECVESADFFVGLKREF